MKTSATFAAIFLFIATLMTSGCMYLTGVDGNGNVIKETREVKSFSAIHVGGAFNIILTQGDTESLTVEADENLQPIIRTQVRENTLEISSEENIRNSKALNIYINFRDLDKMDISGACDISGTSPLRFDRLNFEASGASEIDLELTANFLLCDFSGASEINFSGQAGECEIEVSGASEISAYDLVVEELELRASGASDAKVHATKSLKVTTSAASSVRYMGDPVVDSNISGAGSLKKR